MANSIKLMPAKNRIAISTLKNLLISKGIISEKEFNDTFMSMDEEIKRRKK